MWIGSIRLKKNASIPFLIEQIIKNKVRSLAEELKNELGNKYQIFVTTSVKSESCYLTIKSHLTGKQQTISFRNHNNFAQTTYDKTVDLSQYKTWNHCRTYFLKNTLPTVIKKLDTPSLYN